MKEVKGIDVDNIDFGWPEDNEDDESGEGGGGESGTGSLNLKPSNKKVDKENKNSASHKRYRPK